MTRPLSVRHRLVGTRLRCYREQAGYDLATAASILGCDRSKLSRVETGQRGIPVAELRTLLTEYGADGATQHALVMLARPPASGGRVPYSAVIGEDYADFAIAEAAATHLQVYAPLLVPDLLRTKAYARAAAAADPSVPCDAEELAADIATARQAAVLKERRTGCTVILGETALRQHPCGTDAARGQLAFLTTLPATYPHLRIRVLPFAAGAHPAGGGFSALCFKDAPDLGLILLDGPKGGTCLDDPADITSYTALFAHLSRSSLSPRQSAEMLRQALEAIASASRRS